MRCRGRAPRRRAASRSAARAHLPFSVLALRHDAARTASPSCAGRRTEGDQLALASRAGVTPRRGSIATAMAPIAANTISNTNPPV